MNDIMLTEFPNLYSTNKKVVEEFTTKVYEYAKKYGWITVKDFVNLWMEIPGEKVVMTGSCGWCIEYKDLPKRHNIKKDKECGWYLEMPPTYLF